MKLTWVGLLFFFLSLFFFRSNILNSVYVWIALTRKGTPNLIETSMRTVAVHWDSLESYVLMPSRTDQVFFGLLRFVISFFCSHRSLALTPLTHSFSFYRTLLRKKMNPPNSNTLTNLVCVCNFPVLASTAAAAACAVAAYSSFLSLSLYLFTTFSLSSHLQHLICILIQKPVDSCSFSNDFIYYSRVRR